MPQFVTGPPRRRSCGCPSFEAPNPARWPSAQILDSLTAGFASTAQPQLQQRPCRAACRCSPPPCAVLLHVAHLIALMLIELRPGLLCVPFRAGPTIKQPHAIRLWGPSLTGKCCLLWHCELLRAQRCLPSSAGQSTHTHAWQSMQKPVKLQHPSHLLGFGLKHSLCNVGRSQATPAGLLLAPDRPHSANQDDMI